MSVTAVDPEPPATPVGPTRRLRTGLVAVLVVAVLVIAGGLGWLSRGGTTSAATVPGVNSVDAGFARDMATHHVQAITMAGYERDTTT